MPPKAQPASKKAEAKAKQKIIDDKTFGLKNKNKSSKVNKYIQSLEAQVKGTNRKRTDENDAQALKEKKKQEEARKAELAALFKPVVQAQKVAPGVDPKTVICAYFKAGHCPKGDKCKFSHDLAVERKAAKINLYEDRRDSTEQGEASTTEKGSEETMEGWDQNKLEQVIQRKHGPGIKTTTDIVCKYFLEAIEKSVYGWFWECPNGGDECKYRHALPPGFVLKRNAKDADKAASAEDQITLEEFLETERYRIEKKTPVTIESFTRWKEERKAQQETERQRREKEKEAQIKAGKLLHVSGRDLFMYNPDMYMAGDDEEALEMDYSRREECDADQLEEVDEEAFLGEDFENLQIDEEEEGEEDEDEDEDEDEGQDEENDDNEKGDDEEEE